MTDQVNDEVPQPPKPLFTDVDEVFDVLAGKLPDLIKFYDPMVGGRVKHVPRSAHRKFSKLTKVLALSVRPLLLLDEAENERISWTRFQYGRLECMLRVNLAVMGVKVDSKEDACAALLRMLNKYVAPFGKNVERMSAYKETTSCVEWLAGQVLDHANGELMEQINKAWITTPDGRKWQAFCEQLDRSAKSWSIEPPKRFTDARIDHLLRQYQAAAVGVEMRLKVIAAFLKGVDGSSTPWEDVNHQSLNNLLQCVNARTQMRPLANLIHRNVRNSLAHGAAERNRRDRCVVFYDRDVEVRWSFDELYQRTRDITLCALALCTFEPCVQRETFRRAVMPMWRAIEAEEAGQLSSVSPQSSVA